MAFGTIKNNVIDATQNAGVGVDDTKASRQNIVDKANAILNMMLATMGSTYNSENSFSDYAIHLKALAFEAARVIATSEKIYNDLIFSTTRPEFFYQNIETFLFVNQAFPFVNKDDQAIRTFLLQIMTAWFNGARKASIQTALSLAVEQKATFQLHESYLDAVKNPAVDFVPIQHSFRADVFASNGAINLTEIQKNIKFLVDLIKPAHTYLEVRFVFVEDNFEIGGTPENPIGFTQGPPCTTIKVPVPPTPQALINSFNNRPVGTFPTSMVGIPNLAQQLWIRLGENTLITDGFETLPPHQPGQICDVSHLKIFEYQYEDFRHDCNKNLNVPVQNETPYLLSLNKIKTRYGPLGDGLGNLVTSVIQVQVFVNSLPVPVLSVDALKGIITLVNPFLITDVVTVNYSFLRRHYEFLNTNNIDLLLNQFDEYDDALPSFLYSTVLWTPNLTLEDIAQVSCTYQYGGFDALDSSLLNDPSTLVYNKKSSRDKLNDAWVFNSTSQALNYPTQPFVLRQELSLAATNPDLDIFYFNDINSTFNNILRDIFGSETRNKLHLPGGGLAFVDTIDKVYAGLEVSATCTGTQLDRLKSICESSFGLEFNFNQHPDVYKGICPDIEDNVFLLTNTEGYNIAPPTGFPLYYPYGNFYDPDNACMSFVKMNIHDFENDLFDPISEVFGDITAITLFDTDFCNTYNGFLHLNVQNGVPPIPSFPLPGSIPGGVGVPADHTEDLNNVNYPLFPPESNYSCLTEELHMQYVMGLQNDTFKNLHKFLMNNDNSLTNNTNDCSIIGVHPMNPLCGDGTNISEWLTDFTLGTQPPFIDGFGPGFPENPPAPFTDSFTFLQVAPDFSVSGFFDGVDAIAFDVNALDDVPGATDADGMAISARYHEQFSGSVVLFPYFITHFAPIFDQWWGTNIMIGATGGSGVGSTGFGGTTGWIGSQGTGSLYEIVPVPVDTSYDILLM